MWIPLILTAAAASAATDWTTPAEASAYTETPRYAQTRAYFERLDAACSQLSTFDFGTSAQGRPMQAVVLAAGGELSPEAARASGKPVILIQAAIHPGEHEGKDVLMALARDLTVSGKYSELLEPVVLVLVPVFNVDGHERFSPFNRINQNGPEAMGWRATAQNLNLNRDYTKADAPEMQAWLRLWQRWQPDLLIDMHNTNGADYQYAMTWAFETERNIAPALAAWQREVFDGAVKPALAAQGWPLTYYISLKDGTDLRAGLVEGASAPRFSIGYAAAAGRPGLLLETHMLKDFKTRAAVNEALLLELLRSIGRDPAALKAAVAAADAERFTVGSTIPLDFGLTEATVEEDFLGYAYTRTQSDVSGGIWVQYDINQPETYRLPVQREVIVAAEAPAPAAYVVPPQWTAVIERLQLHAVQMQRLPAAQVIDAERYRFSEVVWAARPFEGRHMISALKQVAETGPAELTAGSWLIPMDQPRARLVALLLEPGSPDSLLRWGFFDAIFEEKEYAEARVMETMAREMLASDPALKAEFDARLQDEAFAGSPRARLRFFYERSPYFDAEFSRYPVLRLGQAALQQLAQ
jgi:murein tripeptide amidase MpaA